MNGEEREELRRVTVQAAAEQWRGSWDAKTLTGSSVRGDARPYAYLGKAKLRKVELKGILSHFIPSS
jgi:hypothetical protein